MSWRERHLNGYGFLAVFLGAFFLFPILIILGLIINPDMNPDDNPTQVFLLFEVAPVV